MKNASRLVALALAMLALLPAACARAPSAAPGPSLPPLPSSSVSVAERAAPEPSSAPGSEVLPPLPAVETFDAAPEMTIGAATQPATTTPGSTDPFAPPPSTPLVLAPVPARPPGTEPPADKRARTTAACAEIKQCGVCNNAGYCGYCMAEHRCVPKDANGPYPGTCSAGFSPQSCGTLYEEAAEPKTRERLQSLLRGMSPIGAPIDTKADGLEKLPAGHDRVVRSLGISVHRGFCYGLLVRASLDLNVDLGTRLDVEAPFFEDGGTFVAVQGQTGALTRFCPQKDGTISVMMLQDHRSPLPSAGRGTLRLQLFREAIGEAELRAREARNETEKRQSWVRYACGHCNKVTLVCKLRGEPDCAGQYRYCMTQGRVTPADCERGDTKDPAPPKSPWDI